MAQIAFVSCDFSQSSRKTEGSSSRKKFHTEFKENSSIFSRCHSKSRSFRMTDLISQWTTFSNGWSPEKSSNRQSSSHKQTKKRYLCKESNTNNTPPSSITQTEGGWRLQFSCDPVSLGKFRRRLFVFLALLSCSNDIFNTNTELS